MAVFHLKQDILYVLYFVFALLRYYSAKYS